MARRHCAGGVSPPRLKPSMPYVYARDALIDLWCEDGFKVAARHNRVFLELAGLSDEIRKRLGAAREHEKTASLFV
jgi:hypothetical protein